MPFLKNDHPPKFILALSAKLVIDLFTGGDASTGIEQAIGRHVDVAIHQDADAIGVHEINHPQTRHYREDIRRVDPLLSRAARQRACCTHPRKRNRVTAKTERNVFKELLDTAIASSKASIRMLEDTRETAQFAMEILAVEYESGPGATERSPDFIDSMAYGMSLATSPFRPNWKRDY